MSKERPKTTIYDVADRAGVAISTVSRVLNDSSDVSEPTRQRVLRAIDELQFRPHRVARTLAQKQTHTLAVAIPTFTMPYHNELLKGIRTRLRDQNIDLLLCDLGSTAQHQTLLNFLKRGAVDGLLLVGVPVDDRIARELSALHASVVLIGTEHDAFDSFYWDDVAGAKAAVDHLRNLGHTRIAMITAHVHSPVQDQRIEGYKQALIDGGLEYTESLVQSGQTRKHAGFSEEAGYEAMQNLLELEPRVTAVFASSDVQAIGAWKAIRDAGLRVPEDIALTGYDDIKTSQYIGLTSVDQSMHEVGEEAIELLLSRLRGEFNDDPVSRKIVPRLKARESSIKR